jgi:hypothetical protein
MSEKSTLLDISSLPVNAQQELRDFYEFLKGRYSQEKDRSGFTPENYRGIIEVSSEELRSQLKKLRDAWDRDHR